MIDAEILHMLHLFLDRLGVSVIMLNINTLGCPECRKTYREVLQAYSCPWATVFARHACAVG